MQVNYIFIILFLKKKIHFNTTQHFVQQHFKQRSSSKHQTARVLPCFLYHIRGRQQVNIRHEKGMKYNEFSKPAPIKYLLFFERNCVFTVKAHRAHHRMSYVASLHGAR